MVRQVQFIFVVFLLGIVQVYAQEFRTIDGSNNNLEFPEWGKQHSPLVQVTAIGFDDGISSISGLTRPNPRVISNALFDQDDFIGDPLGLSDFVWIFGQFIDHDITLVDDNMAEPIMIPVPMGDPHFDPQNTGQVMIPLFRSMPDPNSGTSLSNPRKYLNSITTWIDASSIYGSDQERADWLRTFQNGKLKTSHGNLLPFNTMTGEFGSAIDPDAPEMAMSNPSTDRMFVAGDVRANENLGLISIHTLFVREHNRLCNELLITYPTWTDEQLYQTARKKIGAYIQSIVYNEWLPAMGIHLERYTGYQLSQDPRISNVFAAAAFRMGHTLLNSQVLRIDNQGSVIPEGNLSLKEAFFVPTRIFETGIDPLIKGMASQSQQNMDCKLVDDVRNFLFESAGEFGLDLAAINIQRGRERGLSDYNTIRENFGLPRLNSFQEICSDRVITQMIEDVYHDINNIDPWVGFLAEEHMADAILGETVMTIMKTQFSALRDGDRYYYEADVHLTPEEITEIRNTKLSDIILRNTELTVLQKDVFTTVDHKAFEYVEAISGNAQVSIHPFPVPFTNDLSLILQSTKTDNGRLEIYNLLGQIVYSENIKVEIGQNLFELSLEEGLPNGFYTVSVSLPGIKEDHKILKAN